MTDPHHTPQIARGHDSFDITPLVMLLVAGIVIGYIVAYPGLVHCPNDASRWNTVYYLLEHGTYAYRPEDKVGEWFRSRAVDPTTLTPEKREQLVEIEGRYYKSPTEMPVFWTIDMVRIDGKYKSSKPPLLPTCLAGIAWTVQSLTGANFRDDPWFVIRTTLIIAQVLPLMVFIYLMSVQIRRMTDSAFAQSFCIIAAATGTYLTPWATTLNNHVIAACCVGFALHATLRVWYDGRREWYWFALGGFFGALAATMELPSALLTAAVLVAVGYKAPRLFWIACLAAAVPTAAFFATNWMATGSLSPAYAGFGVEGGPYDYPGSYWLNPQGIDALAEPWWFYHANILIGHHGFFLLTPIFVICLLGIFHHLRPEVGSRTALAAFVVLATAVVACFYTFYTSESRNYGGTTQGPRWMFWLIPLWLLMLPGGVERLARSRAGRATCHALLLVSIFSAGYALRQPWSAPWAQALFRVFGWIDY